MISINSCLPAGLSNNQRTLSNNQRLHAREAMGPSRTYRKSSIKSPGAYLFQTHLTGRGRGRRLIETGRLFERGGLLNLAKTMVVRHKELGMQTGKAQVQEVGGHAQPRIKSKSKLPAGE